jgi:hypothetical protein
MNIRRWIAMAVGIVTLSAVALVGMESPASADVCPRTRDVYIPGGESHYTLTCSGGNVYVHGSVKDEAIDGKCVRVKALIAGHWFVSEAACGFEVIKYFSWHNSGNEAFVYTYKE